MSVIIERFPTTNNSDASFSMANNVYSSDGVYATATILSKNVSISGFFGGFDFSVVPANAVINSISLEVKWKVSTTSSIATLKMCACDYSTQVLRGTELSVTSEPTTVIVSTTTQVGTWTVAELLSNTFGVKLTATRGNSNTAFTASFDYVKVLLDYTILVTHTLDISCPDGHGTSSLGQGSLILSEGSKTISALPLDGYLFDHMTIGGVDYTTNDNVIPFTSDTAVVLYFKTDPSTIIRHAITGASTVESTLANTSPYNTYYHDVRFEYLLLAEELVSCGMKAGNITKIGLKYGNIPPQKDIVNFTVKMKLTSSVSVVTSAFDNTNLTTCLIETVDVRLNLDSESFHMHTLTNPFPWDGVSNLMIDISKDDSTYSGSQNVNMSSLIYSGSNRSIGSSNDSTTAWADMVPSMTGLFMPVTKLGFIADVVSTVPTISIVSHTRDIISQIEGVNSCHVIFTSDKDLLEWEARAGGSGVGQGLLVGNGTTLTANTEQGFDIDCTELTFGDISYKINVYGRNSEGWSAYE